MSRRVLVHVGTPKTGTSHLQDVLFRNREVLREHGIDYPADRFDAHFLAALDLMRLTWGGLEAEAIGAWDSLAARVREWDGTSVISHEILAGATRMQARRAIDSFGDAEVHVLVSVRDLVRQIPAEWQENVKHRSHLGYARFLEQVRDPARTGRIGSWFWAVQEIPDVLDRWAGELPPEQVHLVTVPAPGAEPGELWSRFSRAFGLDDLPLELTAVRANPSLGAAETALLRRLNKQVTPVVEPADYRPLVREVLAHQTLSQRRTSPRLALPPDLYDWAQELSGTWVEEVRARGYDVVGDLGDLIGPPPSAEWTDPDDPAEADVSAAALDALQGLLLEATRLRRSEEQLHGELARAHEELAHTKEALDRAYLRPSYRLREALVRRLEGAGAGRGLLWVYRRVRGRNSRSA